MPEKRASGAPDRRGLRIGEDDPGEGLVVGVARLAQDVRGDDVALVLAGRRQRPDPGDVTDRPESVRSRAQLRVDREPAAVGLDADGLEPDAVDPRAATRRDEQAVTPQLGAARRSPGRSRRRLGVPRSHARRASARCRRGAGPRRAPRPAVPARGRARARRTSTSATSPPRRRTAWAISTPTGPPPRISRRRGTAVIAVTSRFVHTPSRPRRPGTGGVIGSAPVATTTCRAVWRTPSTSTAPGPGEPAAAAQQIDAVVGEPLRRACVGVLRDHVVAPRQCRFDVDVRSRGRVVRVVYGFTRAEQGLGRDAGPVGALASHQLTLDHGDAETALGQRAGAVLTGRAGAEDDDVVVGVLGVLGVHGFTLRPAAGRRRCRRSRR